MIVGITAWLLAALACYFALRKTVYNFLDPLLLTTIFIPFSGALLAVLCNTDWITWDKLILFCVVLGAFLIGARAAGTFFDRHTFRRLLVECIESFSRREINAILLFAVFATLLLAVLGLQEGAGGDARQEFNRAFRPIMVVQSGLFFFALLLLLSRKLSNFSVSGWLFALLVLAIPFSGKSVLAPLLTWFGLKFYVEQRKVSFRAVTTLFSLAFISAAGMGYFAYGVSSLFSMVIFVTNRLWMSGDVYIFAYEREGLAFLRGNYEVSFIPYMLHPLTSLVGIRGYEKPLGSMLASELLKVEVLTGPNPQLPVLLDFFFPNSLLTSFGIAFVIGFVVVGLRPLGIALANTRSRHVRLGGLAAAIFCPVAGFLDVSLVWIALIGVVAVTIFITALDLATSFIRDFRPATASPQVAPAPDQPA